MANSLILFLSMLARGKDSLAPSVLPKASIFRAVFNDLPSHTIPLISLCGLSWREKLDDDWIDLLDCLGKDQLRGFLFRPLPDELLENLRRAFAEDEQCLGLMRLMSIAVAAGQTCEVNLFSLEPARFAEPSMREAAIVIILGQKGWEDLYQPFKLAECLTALGVENPDSVIQPIRVAGRQQPLSKGALELLIGLRYGLPPTCWKGIELIVQYINEHLSRRTSGLDDPETVRRLGLPISTG